MYSNTCLKEKLKLFKKIQALTPSQRSKFIKDLTEKEVKSLCEIFKNIASRKLNCDKLIKSKLRNYKSDIKNLANITSQQEKNSQIHTRWISFKPSLAYCSVFFN